MPSRASRYLAAGTPEIGAGEDGGAGPAAPRSASVWQAATSPAIARVAIGVTRAACHGLGARDLMRPYRTVTARAENAGKKKAATFRSPLAFGQTRRTSDWARSDLPTTGRQADTEEAKSQQGKRARLRDRGGEGIQIARIRFVARSVDHAAGDNEDISAGRKAGEIDVHESAIRVGCDRYRVKANAAACPGRTRRADRARIRIQADREIRNVAKRTEDRVDGRLTTRVQVEHPHVLERSGRHRRVGERRLVGERRVMRPEVRAGAAIQIVAARADHPGPCDLAAECQRASCHDARQ